MQFDFPNQVIGIIEQLNLAGYDAYIVGGAVRDQILGVPLTDFDITTNAKVDEIKEVFSDCKIIETGIKHGTVTIIKNSFIYEITTFRQDGKYSDLRHPESVKFVTSLNEDLSRRDFTINAMAYSPKSGLVDLFDGLGDLKNGVIRTVGDAEKRFNEDGLRILRAVRFSSKLGFKIEDETFKAMLKCKDNLDKISVERIFSEMTKTLCGKYAESALRDNHEILFKIIPELACEYMYKQNSLSHDYDVFEHTLKAISYTESHTPTIMWTLLLHDVGKPHCYVLGLDGFGHFPGHMEKSSEIADKLLKRLKASNEIREKVVILTKYHDASFKNGKIAVKKFIAKFGKDIFADLLTVKKADCLAHSEHGIAKYYPEVELITNAFSEIQNNNECCSLSDLAINGNDILDMGVKSKDVGKLLNIALNKVFEGKLNNTKAEILDYIKKYV